MSKKTVIVTGGARGLGLQLTRSFAEAGYEVYVISRSPSRQMDEMGSSVIHVAADLLNLDELSRAVAEIARDSETIDGLVNNSGLSGWKPLEKITPDFWERMLDLNLRAPLFVTQAVVPLMKPGGSIVNISSLAGKRGSARNAVYCATKFGLNGVTQSLAKELGDRQIRVNAVCPVYVETDGLMEALEDEHAPPGGEEVRAYLDNFARTQAALGRMPGAGEVADTVLYLLSGSASAITGQCLNVDCGVLPQ